jgi:hypothetical protein
MKKLVELDPNTLTTKEFDCVKIARSATELRAYLLQLSPADDQFHIKDQVLPIVERALEGTLNLPFEVQQKPLRYESTEGLLPREYNKLAAPFFVAIYGMSGLGTDALQPIHKDGKIFAWMEFEDDVLG